MVVDDVINILVILLLFIVVDVHHSKSRATLPDSIPLLSHWVGLILKLDEQFFPTRLEFVHLHLHTRHCPLLARQVYINLLGTPLVDELRDKVGQMAILVNLHYQSGEKEFRQLNEFDTRAAKATVGIRSLSTFQATLAGVTRTALLDVSFK